MNRNEPTNKNIIKYINSLVFEPEKYTNERKKRYYHNLSYYEIDYDVDKLDRAIVKDTFMRFLDQKIKQEIKKNIISNMNFLYGYVGFKKRFSSLPTQEDYDNLSNFSKFLNMYDLGYQDSEDNTYQFIVKEIVNTVQYLHPEKNSIYNNELFSIATLALKIEDFERLIQILIDYKQESETLNQFKNWAEIYHSIN